MKMWKLKKRAKDWLRSADMLKKPDFYCNICCRDVRFALDSPRHMSPLFESGNIVGAGFRPRTKCPYCNGGDRLRFAVEVIRRCTDMLTAKCRVLEFAAAEGTKSLLTKNPNCEYHSADINEGAAEMVINITDINLPDDSYDYIICMHVLEHVPDEAKAVSEMKRVCKNRGKLLITVPVDISRDQTFVSPEATTPADRLRLYGQSDHVRLYGSDVCDRLSSYGMKVRELRADECLAKHEIKRLKVIPNDRAFICEVLKP